MRKSLSVLMLLAAVGCSQNSDFNRPEPATQELKTYSSESSAQVMVLGTYHFAQESATDELSPENQEEIEEVLNAIQKFQPTKVVIEIEPERSQRLNELYGEYRVGAFSIDTLANEIFQLGFKMADRMGHESIYLFDDQTPFIGSLEGFSWAKFNEYAEGDSTFIQKHFEKILSTFAYNDSLLKTLHLYDRIRVINSLQAQKLNAQRMHMYELRVGIGDNWMGPDWLGRWYRRNIRMMGHLLKMSNPDDRLLVIVGDNHKWVLEDLMNYTPDFEVVGAYEYLNQD